MKFTWKYRHTFAVIVAVLLTAFVVVWWSMRGDLERRFSEDVYQYPPPPNAYERVTLTTGDGVNVSGWYIPAPNPRGALVLLHGYDPKGGKASMLPIANMLHDAGYATEILDLRGTGESDGTRTWVGIKEWQEAAAAHDDLAARPELAGKHIGMLGVSTGAAAATIAASTVGKTDFLVLVSPVADYDRMFAFRERRRPEAWIPGWQWFLRVALKDELGADYASYSPAKRIADARVPVLVVWSQNDDVIGPDQGGALFAAAGQPKQEWRADAGDDIVAAMPDEFRKRLNAFLAAYVP